MALDDTHDYTFNRPPRIRRSWRIEHIELPEPPLQPQRQDQNIWISVALPVVGVVLLGAAMAFVSAGSNVWVFLVPMLVMSVMGVVTTLLSDRDRNHRASSDFEERRKFFEERLAAQQEILKLLYEEEQEVRRELNPAPEMLIRIASARGTDLKPESRLWERRSTDDDFMDLRVGLGSQPFSTSVRVPPPPRDGSIDRRLYELAEQYRTLDKVPITIPLAKAGSLGITGSRNLTLPLLHALIWQAVVLHSPNDLRLAAVFPAEGEEQWDWLRWLAHTIPLSNDSTRNLRMCASDEAAVNQLMSELLDQFSRRRDLAEKQRTSGIAPLFTHILLIVDGSQRVRNQPVIGEIMRYGAALGMSVVFLDTRWQELPDQCAYMVDVQERQALWAVAGGQWPKEGFVIDRAETTMSDPLARRLAGIRLVETGGNQDLPRSVRLFDLLEVKDAQDLMPPRFWNEPLTTAWRPDVPIGASAGGKQLFLDLYENRHGPHGIIAGATGAGKSVLLQCIIASLVVKHPPTRMQLLLIDFKGGASLAMFEPLPHTVGFVTDLEGRLAERAMTAIKSEIRYRKLLLKQTARQYGSKVENITDYRELEQQHTLPPLSNLLIVIDEFDEMAKTYQDFVTELVRVVKQGRSLGVHLLLATQQPSKAVTDEIRTQLKFFIALRLGSSEDSREMLLKPDAAFLPTNIPGRAYFRVGSEFELFQVAQITGEYRNSIATGRANTKTPRIKIYGSQANAVSQPSVNVEQQIKAERKLTDLDVLVQALREKGEQFIEEESRRSQWVKRPIWQAPLPRRMTLAELGLTLEQSQGMWMQRPVDQAWLRVTIGRLDIPQESRQEPLRLSLAAGHMVIVGAPGSGKTMLLRTLVLSLALTHSPQDAWCYLVDAGGQGLSPLIALPHVGALIQMRERERIRRLLLMLETTIRERQDRFREAGVGDLAAYHLERQQRLPALVVVIDKIALLREEFDDGYGNSDIIDQIVRLVRIGRSYGIHFVITADRAADISYKLLSLLETRIALRLPELHDYNDLLGGRVSGQIPPTMPGRGLWMQPEQGMLDLQVAMPSLEGRKEIDADNDVEQATILDSELIADLKETISNIAQLWQALPGARSVRPLPVELLPEQLSFAHLESELLARQPVGDLLAAPIGRESHTLGTVCLEFSPAMPHALIVGGRRSGKTAALTELLLALATRYSPAEVRIIVIDGPKRELRVVRDLPHVESYVQNETEIKGIVSHLISLRRERNEVRRWIIALDDYHLSVDTMKNQFKPTYGDEANLFGALCDLATLGGQYGVHLVIAANISYAGSDALLNTLDQGRNGLIMWPGRFEGGTKFLGVALPREDQRDVEQPPGRALLVREETLSIVQVARVTEANLTQLIEAAPA